MLSPVAWHSEIVLPACQRCAFACPVVLTMRSPKSNRRRFMDSCCDESIIAPVSMDAQRPRCLVFGGSAMLMVADGKDVVSTSKLDVAIFGSPPGSNIPAVPALLSVTTTSVRRSSVPVVVEVDCESR